MARKKMFFKRSAKKVVSNEEYLFAKSCVIYKLFSKIMLQICKFYLWKNYSEIVRICIRDDDEKQERKYYSLGEKTNVI